MLKKDYVGRSLANRDLTGHDFTQHSLYRTNLRGSKLRDCRIAVSCDTFDGVQLDDSQVALFILLLAKADIDVKWVDTLRACVVERKGERWTARAQAMLRAV